MSGRRYNSDTLWRLYQIGGAELALRYVDLASRPETRSERASGTGTRLEVQNLRFYAGGSRVPGVSERRFASRFPKSSTRFVYFQVDMKNPWRYVSVEYKLVARCYKPDGSLMGEFEDQVVTKPEREMLWHTSGWGWEKAGNWLVGVYRVEVLIDHEHRLAQEFAVFEDEIERLFEFRPSRLLDRSPFISEEFPHLFSPHFPEASGRNPRKVEKGPKGPRLGG